MLQIAANLPLPGTGTPAAKSASPEKAGEFSGALSLLLVDEDVPEESDEEAEGLQLSAEAGKELPEVAQDPAFAWFAAILPVDDAVADTSADPKGLSGPEGLVVATPPDDGDAVIPLDSETQEQITKAIDQPEQTELPAKPPMQIGKKDAATFGDQRIRSDRFSSHAVIALAARDGMQPASPAPDKMGVILPAIFSPIRRMVNEPAPSFALNPTQQAQAISGHTVAAAGDVQQAPLDLRRQEWMGQMIERIEMMRDAAPVRETRIRLVPDALGRMDITVRQDGERVHVHFAAETQAARQILSDAQPRLVELADQRGVRLGQTSVDGGQGGGTQSDLPQHANQQRHDEGSADASLTKQPPAAPSEAAVDSRIA